MAKRLDSVYQPGRRGRDLAQDQDRTRHQEVVIGGWRPGQGRRDGGIGSLLMGIPTPDGLRYVGRVGSGFNDRDARRDPRRCWRRWPARPRRSSTCRGRTPGTPTGWTPELVGEVTYGELTEPGRLRHPVWHGLRPDKSPDEVVWEGQPLPIVTQASIDRRSSCSPRWAASRSACSLEPRRGPAC